MPASRRVTYGVGAVIGLAVVILAIPSQQGIQAVETNSPGILSGNGKSTSPLNATLTVDNVTMTGTGSAGSPLSAGVTADLPLGLFGTGVDGSSSPCGTISVNTTLARTIHCTSLTINTGIVLNPGGYRIFVNGTLTLSGTGKISASGGNASGGTAGGGGGNGYHELCPGGNGGQNTAGGGAANFSTCGGGGFPLQPDECSNSGGAGANATPTGAATPGIACKGGGGGQGRNNGSGPGGFAGQVNPAGLVGGSWRAPMSAYFMVVGYPRGAAANPFGNAYTGGTGGGSGGAGDFQGQCIVGAGGGGGGVVMVAARKIVGTGSIESNGGNGSNAGSTGGNPICGGGGGGGGGVVSVFIGTGSFPTTSVTAGIKGTGRGGGTDGANGGPGVVTRIKAGV